MNERDAHAPECAHEAGVPEMDTGTIKEWDAFIEGLFAENSPQLRERVAAVPGVRDTLQARVHWLADRWEEEGWGDELGTVGWHLLYQLTVLSELCASSRDEFKGKRRALETRLKNERAAARDWCSSNSREMTLYRGR